MRKSIEEKTENTEINLFCKSCNKQFTMNFNDDITEHPCYAAGHIIFTLAGF
jgi:hypothetical protein